MKTLKEFEQIIDEEGVNFSDPERAEQIGRVLRTGVTLLLESLRMEELEASGESNEFSRATNLGYNTAVREINSKIDEILK